MYDNALGALPLPIRCEEGDDDGGVDEREVRLDELLVEPGDGLLYEYDFGDSSGCSPSRFRRFWSRRPTHRLQRVSTDVEPGRRKTRVARDITRSS